MNKFKLCDPTNCNYNKENICSISNIKCDGENVFMLGDWYMSCRQFDNYSCSQCDFRDTCNDYLSNKNH